MQGIEIKAAGEKTAEVLIYDFIGKGLFEDGVTAKGFAKELKALGKVDTINVRINSPGGSVAEGTAIYNTLKNHSAKVIVDIDGAAFSIASVIAMAGDEIRMAESALMMIHEPSLVASGTAKEVGKAVEWLTKSRDNLANIYAERTNRDRDEVLAMMADETWFDAEEAKAAGFIDTVTGALQMAAKCDLEMMNRVPQRFKDRIVCALNDAESASKGAKKMAENATAGTAAAPIEPQLASYESIVASCEGADATFICSQLAAKSTQKDAEKAWQKELNARLQTATKALDELKNAKPAPAARPGVDPLTSTSNSTATAEVDPIAAWNDAIQAKVKGGMARAVAVKAVNRENPELREAYVAAYNSANGRRAG